MASLGRARLGRRRFGSLRRLDVLATDRFLIRLLVHLAPPAADLPQRPRQVYRRVRKLIPETAARLGPASEVVRCAGLRCASDRSKDR
ncbi:MAG: hypothetical protein H0T91_01535 [Propionibacteriaceae bacterium]|nr:hypothetical protein [Propionibacteriaceae bacterium]